MVSLKKLTLPNDLVGAKASSLGSEKLKGHYFTKTAVQKMAALLSSQTRHLPQTSCLGIAIAQKSGADGRQESRGLAQGGRRGCQDLYFRPGAAWPIFQRIMVMQLWSHLNRLAMMKLNLPRPSGSGFNACFHENDHLQRFFQAKKHSTPGSLSPLKLCLPLQHELKAMQR